MEVVIPMLYFIPPYLRKLSWALVVLALVPALGFSVIARQARSTASLRVTAHDEADRAFAAVVVELKRGDAVVIKTATDEKGVAEFRNLAPGTYDVFISKEGLETLDQTGVTLSAGAPVEINFTVVPKVNLTDTVTVQAGADTHVEKTASVASELARATLKALPGKPATVKDTLPLVPGVVRSPEGEIKISGQAEHRSALIVNSADVTDPAT